MSQIQRESSFEILHQSPSLIQLLIRGVSTQKLNDFRHIVSDDIPTIAVEEVEIRDNMTGMLNEILAHKLSLVPLWSEDADLMPFIDECDDPEITSSNCAIEFRLRKICKGPNNCKVTSDDFEYVNGPIVEGQKLNVVPVSQIPELDTKPMVIHELRPGQKIDVTLYAYKGTRGGQEPRHAKWSPVSVVYYQRIPRILLNPRDFPDSSVNEQRQVIEKCTQDLMYFDKLEGRYRIRRQEQLEEVGCPADRLDFDRKDDYFMFTLETTGSLTPERILLDGVQIYQDQGLGNDLDGIYDLFE